MPKNIRVPVPDPFGLLEDLTKDSPVQLFDPLVPRKSVEDPAEELSGDQVEMYTHHLEQALRHAPCPGCKKVVLGGLTTAEIFKYMEETGLPAKDIDDEIIENIKKHVKDKYV